MNQVAFVKILPGCGLGNQIQFIPALRELNRLYSGYVFTDSKLFGDLEIAIYHSDIMSNIDSYYIPMWPDWKHFWEWRKNNFGVPCYGFKYRILKQWIGLGYTKSYKINLNEPEVINNRRLVPNDFPFHLKGHDPKKGTIVVSIPQGNKYKRQYAFLTDLVSLLLRKDYEVTIIGEGGLVFDSYKGLYEFMCGQEFYIGGDCGIMHLADILGMRGVVIWGDTKEKNKPINNLRVINGLFTPVEIVYETLLSLQSKAILKTW